MVSRQTFAVGTLGMVVGMLVGVTSADHAALVSFSGNDPNTATIRSMDQIHQAAGYVRFRSDDGVIDEVAGTVTRLTAPRRASLDDMVAHRANVHIADFFHASAPTWTIRGQEVNTSSPVPECAQYSGARYTRCLEAMISGSPFEANYFPISY